MKRVALLSVAVLVLSTLALADVTLPPPEGKGTLKITGQAGAGQRPDAIFLFACESAPATVYKKHSCKKLDGTFTLNTAIPLDPGPYLIEFENSWASSEIEVGKESTVSLVKVTAPVASDKAVKFRLFVDLTNDDEQDRFVLNMGWALGGKAAEAFEAKVCDGTTDWQPLCQALKKKPAALKGVLFRFNTKGAVYRAVPIESCTQNKCQYWVEWEKLGRFSVMNQEAGMGNFVSVFPGTYALDYFDSQNRVSTRYGIEIR